ncbi:MAG: UDP-N-acetylmuramate dehydrogenase [Porphyromonadaceae bacterium]|nr:UDP-N-acetylmuramate dehydrogenase [Porphyromonadaceae bacterium]
MNIEKDCSLRRYNTFGINAQADWLIHYDSVDDLRTLVRDEYFQECRLLHIGEGSNLLFLANFHGIVLRSEIKDVELLSGSDEVVDLLVGAGLVWDDFVQYCVQRGYYGGAENLSLVPGQVGAAAIQNIGAYGMEIERLVVAVHALHRRTGEQRIFRHEECHYSYRHSIFKEADQADYIVTHVHFRLGKQPSYMLDYAELNKAFVGEGQQPSLEAIRELVCSVRRQKLPDVEYLGNAGSFFMNPIIRAEEAEVLLKAYPNMPHYPHEDGMVKLAAGWLIDQCGLKGYQQGAAGVYERQALVLVNHGGATGQDIANLAIYIQEQVRGKFGIDLQPEVRYIS